MKIDVVYEKGDILRLIVDDLKRKGIKIRANATPIYKGALAVKLSVDAEDTDDVGDVPIPTVEEPQKQVTAEPVNMSDVLNQSENLVMTKPGKFERRPERVLGPSESYEFPKEDK